MKYKKTKIAIVVLLIAIIALGIAFFQYDSKSTELKSIKSMKELENRYSYNYNSASEILTYIFTLPFSIMNFPSYDYAEGIIESTTSSITGDILLEDSVTSNVSGATSSKDYSTTNIQVENVDEADIVKTDGDYIYSISENNVIITDVQDEQNPRISARIADTQGIPEEYIILIN